MDSKQLVFVIGPTNAGKSSLLAAAGRLGHTCIEVGKALRAKYMDPASPHYAPDYFKGEAAPQHTALEAWTLMVNGIAAAPADRLIFVDGQPRDIQQCDEITEKYVLNPAYQVLFYNVYAPRDVRLARARARDTDPDRLKLSMDRMDGDIPKLYEVLCRIASRGHTLITTDSTMRLEYEQQVIFLKWYLDIKRGIDR